MALISLVEYGERHNKNRATVRQKAKAGAFTTARKIGRNWVIEEDEPYPEDKRVKSGEYKDWRKPKNDES